LNYFTAAPHRQYQGFLWFERTDARFMRDSQFDFARPENRESLREDQIAKLAEMYLADAVAAGGQAVPLEAIRNYFLEINRQIRWVEASRLQSEGAHLEQLKKLAATAYRRPLTHAEQLDLESFYHRLRDEEELGHEDAIRDCLLSLLLSPNFCYRVDLLSDSDTLRALNDWELASRLSFFLWGSLPDQELRDLADSGALLSPEAILQQTRRMLRDKRVRGLAVEFAGNWLDFRRFEEHNSVDRERYPSFNDELRSSMFEEPIHFIMDVMQNDGSVFDLLYAEYTFVDGQLAKHYGIPHVAADSRQWRRVDHADDYGRGGLLPMAVFLTQNSPGLRTSPVKRGYWVVRRLLGERIPPPPPNVPELPADEAQTAELSLREALSRHREHASCAGCHNRFDALGLAFEAYGPVGELRTHDLGGKPVDCSALYPDGSQRDGLGDLKDYLRAQREDDFRENLCRKLLTYALGRSLLISDDRLVKDMTSALESSDGKFSSIVEAIVISPQFLNKRGRE
jgi:hypothetical protein